MNRLILLVSVLFLFVSCSSKRCESPKTIVVKSEHQEVKTVAKKVRYGEDRSGVDVNSHSDHKNSKLSKNLNIYKNGQIIHKNTQTIHTGKAYKNDVLIDVKTSPSTPPSTRLVSYPKELLDKINNSKDIQSVYFDFNSYVLKDIYKKELNSLKGKNAFVALQGNCDEVGSEEYNYILGLKRAESVKKYLVSLGLNEDKIFTKSFGKTRPICLKDTEKCHSKNRRVDFIFLLK